MTDGIQVNAELYDTDGSTFLIRSNYGSSVSFTYALGPGTFFIKVRLTGWSAGGYTISNTFTPASLTNDQEPNDTAGTARALSSPGSTTGHLGYHSGGVTDTADWFKISPTADGILQMSAATDGIQLNLELYDTDGSTFLIRSNYGSSVSFTYALGPGTFFIKVRLTGGTAGSYTISNTYTPASLPNDQDSNNTSGTAQALALPGSTTGHLGYHSSGLTDSVDWFKISASTGGTLQVQVMTDGIEVNAELYGADGSTFLIRSNYGSSVSFTYALGPGTFFIKLRLTGGLAGSYTLCAAFGGVGCGARTPAAPTNLLATALSASTTSLTWTDNSDNETGFKIERKTGTAGTYTQIGTQGQNLNFFNDSGLTASTQYCYRVRATNAAGDSAYSNESCATTSAALPGLPVAPTNLLAVALSASTTSLTWTDNSDNEIGFKIERKTGATGIYAQIATQGQNLNFFNDSSLTASTQYCYRVRATNAAGDSAYSNESCATTQGLDNFTLTGNAYCNTTLPIAPAVMLSWTASSGATGYVVYRNGAAYSGTLPSGQLSYDNNVNVTGGLTYTYFIRATKTAGGADSNTISVTVPSNVCSGCTALAVTTQPANQTISIGQTATLSVVATGTGLRYQWYRGTTGGTSTPVGSDTSSFATPALSATTSYWVRVSDACGGAIDSRTATVTVTGGSSADLIVTDVNPIPLTLLRGETLGIGFTLANQGSSAAGLITAEVRLSTNKNLGLFEGVLLGDPVTTRGLAGGASRRVSFHGLIPASIPLGRYYVKVKTNSDESVAESDLTNDVAVAPYPVAVVEFGVTVITHGFEPGGLPAWSMAMADAIRRRAGGGTISVYDRDTGLFQPPPSRSTRGESVLIFDWSADSRVNLGAPPCSQAEATGQAGFSEAAGDALFAALMSGYYTRQFDLKRLHFIGHSRGAVVNSEAVERLIATGIRVDHVTMLDPVDDGYGGCLPDHDVNRSPAGVVAWKGIDRADVFYRYEDTTCYGVDFKGESVTGARSVDLSSRSPLIDHCDVHAWYYFTIDLQAADDRDSISFSSSWYGLADSGCEPADSSRARGSDGFFFSRLGGGAGSCPEPDKNTAVLFDLASPHEGIVNGDLERPGGAAGGGFGDVPGWRYHGGAGNAEVMQGHLVLRSGQAQRHNRVWIPINARSIAYNLHVEEPNPSAFLTVKLGECEHCELHRISLGSAVDRHEEVDIPASVDGRAPRQTMQTLTFEVGGLPPSNIWVDDVHFVLADVLDAPSYLEATAISSSVVELNWLRNSSNEAAFQIQRRLEGSGTWIDLPEDDPRSLSYSDSTVAACTRYVYRVRARRGTDESPFSNEAAAKTPGCLEPVPRSGRNPVLVAPRP